MAETIETQRLLLRPFVPDDIDEYLRIFTKPELGEFPFGRALTIDEARRSFERRIVAQAGGEIVPWGAIEKRSGRLLGWIGLSYGADYPDYLSTLQVGWRLDPDCWGNGYATEGGQAGVEYAFAHFDIEELLVFAQSENVASVAVALRLGATYTGETFARIPGIEGDIPHVIYSIDRQRLAN